MARGRTLVTLLICSLVAAIGGTSCSSKSATSGTGGSTTTTGGAGTGGATGANTDGGVAVTGCTNSVLSILFSPMYSAYDGTHSFQIPAIVTGVAASAVTWSASDPNLVAFAPDTDTGGVMITVLGSGSVTVIASAGGLCGASLLTISAATPDDWAAGSARYNDGVVIRNVPRGGGPNAPDGGTDAAVPQQAACTNCHGDTANGPYKTVAHTPEQTGGFSDSQLQNIFMNGTIPDGGYFDPTIVSYAQWQGFHKWDMTADEAKGIIVYLRSLTPAPQTGSSNFGGRVDGGVGAGGRRGGAGGRGGGGAGAAGGTAGSTDNGPDAGP